MIALNTSTTKVITRFGRCLRTLYVIHFGPGVLFSLTHLTILRTTEGLIIFACGDIFVSTHFIIKILNPSRLSRIIYGLILSLKTVGQNFYVLTVWESCSSPLLEVGRGRKKGINLFLNFHNESSYCVRIPAYFSIVPSSTHSGIRSPTSEGGWPAFTEQVPSWIAPACTTTALRVHLPEYYAVSER
jgi:hypothetical protein